MYRILKHVNMPKNGYTLYFPKYGVEYWSYQPVRQPPLQASLRPPVITVRDTTLFKKHMERTHRCNEEKTCKCFGNY